MASYNQQSGFLQVCVKDNGIGIPSDKIDQIFDGSQSKGRLAVSGSEGNGLGLLVSEKIVKTFGG